MGRYNEIPPAPGLIVFVGDICEHVPRVMIIRGGQKKKKKEF